MVTGLMVIPGCNKRLTTGKTRRIIVAYTNKRKNKMSNTSTGGIGFSGLLTVLFIGLKLTGNIDWSWLWVLSPLWISFSILVLLWVLLTIAILIAEKIRK